MPKICPSCNTQCQDTELYCPNCGTRLANVRPAQPSWQPQQNSWQPQQPQQNGWQPQQPQQNNWQPQQPQKNGWQPQQPQQNGWQPPQSGAPGYRPAPGGTLGSKPGFINIVAIVLLVATALNAIFGLVFLIGKYNTTLKYDVSGISGDLASMAGLMDDVPSKVNISDIYKLAKEEDVFTGLHALNIFYGLALIALAALAVLLWLRIKKNSRQVPQLFLIYAVGTLASAVVYMLLFHILGTESQSMYGMTAKIWIPYYFYTWLHFLYGIAVTVYSVVMVPKIKNIFTA